MALSRPTFLAHLKALLNPCHFPRRRLPYPTTTSALRFLSFATPDEAAAERRRRKRRLRIEPPLSSLHRAQSSPSPKPEENPDSPKLPEPTSALSGKRLELHNKILKLIRENDLEEAALYTKHSVYSNCRPTIYTVNAVLQAQLRQSKYADLLSLHRFIMQAGIGPNIITHNLIFQTYLDCRRPDTALEHYKQLLNDAPFNPSPATYRIMIKGLVDNGKLDKALEVKGEMVEVKRFSPDPMVYHYLMVGCARENDADGVFKLYEEFKEKLGVAGDELVEDGVIYGGLMKGYFLKGMEKEAMECYETALGENSRVRMSDTAYNSVLDALFKNDKFDEGLKLFDRMLNEHDPPRRLSVNLGSFNVMVDAYCSCGSFNNAIEVFWKMGSYNCSPDTMSFNNLINQLCSNGLLMEAEQVYGEMDKKGVKPDEYTFGLLMDTCFKEGRSDDGAAYFKKMVDLGLRPNLAVYGRLVDQLVKVGKIDEAKSFYDLMVKKLKMDNATYKFMMGALSDAGRLDEVLKMVDEMLDDESIDFDLELQDFVKGELGKEGREEDLGKLMEEKERRKAEAKAKEAEAAEAAKRSARAAIRSLIPSKFVKEEEMESGEADKNPTEAGFTSKEVQTGDEGNVEEATLAVSSPADSNLEPQVIGADDAGKTAAKEEVIKADADETLAKNEQATEQQVAA